MSGQEVPVQHLIGRRVLTQEGRSIGRLEDIVAVQYGAELLVVEYHVGSYAGLERLSAWPIGGAILNLFGARDKQGGYRVKWDELDLSDPEHPRLRCAVSELRRLEP